MAEIKDIYRCNVCGHIIEVIHEGAGTLVCCDQDMEKLEAKTEDQGQEKHVPVIEKTEDGFLVKVGDVPHPMEEKHHIEWIQAIIGDKAYRKFLKAGEKPEMEVKCEESDEVELREYCNVHGLWKKG